MIINTETLRERIHGVILNKKDQGHQIDNLQDQLDDLPSNYDDLMNFAKKLSSLEIKNDWPYVEPNSINEIFNEMDPSRPLGKIGKVDLADSAKRVETAFLGSICGCILGKPLEAQLTGQEIKLALTEIDEWPMKKYVSKDIKSALPRVHNSFPETAREYIKFVAPDDDINYTIMGMLILEKFGSDFTHADMRNLWLTHLPINTTFGPERTILLKTGIESLNGMPRSRFSEKGGVGENEQLDIKSEQENDLFKHILNPGDELCGALIRADAYGYAFPGNPSKSSELAWKDASFTHSRTGIYGTMFIAAAISCAQVMDNRNSVIETALQFVPQKSRFFERTLNCYKAILESSNWEEGYNKINAELGEYGHCRIYQEVGMLINTFLFAKNVGDGICIQVSQGADTDSFGATVGSLLGAYFGPGHLDEDWLKPFNDDIHTGLAWFFERSISKLANRMSRLPSIVEKV